MSHGAPGVRRLGAVVALAGLLSGCVPVPVVIPERLRHEGSPRGPIPDGALAFLTTGKTTRTEVLLHLGQPDEVSDPDDHQSVYTWAVNVRTIGLLLLGMYNNQVYTTKVERHRLLLEFGETGILRAQDHRVQKTWEE